MIAGLRDRALIGLMVYSSARIGAVLGMKIEDVFTRNRRLWVRLRERGGKLHAMPCHHNLEAYLTAYINGAGLAEDPKWPLFYTIGRGKGRSLTRTALQQAEAYLMIARRAAAAGIATMIGNHSFRATGITVYLKNGGTLEKAAQMANHASTRTTQLYDRRRDVTSGVNLSQNHRFEFPYDVASACRLDPIEDAAVLGPIKAKPFGWPRKPRPALTGPARDGVRPGGRDERMLAARIEPKNGLEIQTAGFRAKSDWR